MPSIEDLIEATENSNMGQEEQTEIIEILQDWARINGEKSEKDELGGIQWV